MENFDVIILGTGLVECILSAKLSLDGKRVLHIDRNDYYGGNFASLNLEHFYALHNAGTPPETLGRTKDYAIDRAPKLIMAAESIVDTIVEMNASHYFSFKQIMESYVFHNGRAVKIPSTPTEALASSLMGPFEKRRVKRFFEHAASGNGDRQKDIDDVYDAYGLVKATREFINHAICLFPDERKRTLDTVADAITLYNHSIQRYGKSPYIYPEYGLGELPQGFARLAAVNGATFMLDRPVDEIVPGVGVRVGEEFYNAPLVICDPSYREGIVAKHVVRATCILRRPPLGLSDSYQLIIPGSTVKRKNDVYLCVLSSAQRVCPDGFFIAYFSTTAETSTPDRELDPFIGMLGIVEASFVSVDEIKHCGEISGVIVTASTDATTHFRTITDEIERIYKKVSTS